MFTKDNSPSMVLQKYITGVTLELEFNILRTFKKIININYYKFNSP